jgi:broad specificity phosphatase PhoE
MPEWAAMVEIIFESHSTTIDNENHVSSGHYDVELSELGTTQSKELGERYREDSFDTIFCSDLQRSYKTAEITFGDRFKIIRDGRLRECDYGELTRHPSGEVDGEKPRRISEPFPGGESYEQAAERMRSFLGDLLRDYDGKRVMVIGHRATQYGLEHWIKGVPLEEAVVAPWKWQPGWRYELRTIR